jgi:hypothetical protein
MQVTNLKRIEAAGGTSNPRSRTHKVYRTIKDLGFQSTPSNRTLHTSNGVDLGLVPQEGIRKVSVFNRLDVRLVTFRWQ